MDAVIVSIFCMLICNNYCKSTHTNIRKTATQIFSEAGLDPQILGKERIHKS